MCIDDVRRVPIPQLSRVLTAICGEVTSDNKRSSPKGKYALLLSTTWFERKFTVYTYTRESDHLIVGRLGVYLSTPLVPLGREQPQYR